MRKELKTKFDIKKAIMKGYTILDDYERPIALLNLAGNVYIDNNVLKAVDTIVDAIYKSGGCKYIHIDEYKNRIYIQNIEEFIDLLGQGKEIYEEDYDNIKYCMRAGIIYAIYINNDSSVINPDIVFSKDKFYYKETDQWQQ